MHSITSLCWRTLALLCVALGMIGVVVPGLPTVPFLLVAAWAGAKGWPELERWLLEHPKYGPHIRQWREHGAVPRRAKLAAGAMMLLSAVLIGLSSAPLAMKVGLPLFMTAVFAWLWSRPEPTDCDGSTQDSASAQGE